MARAPRRFRLPAQFPERALFEHLLAEYGSRPSYWYVPKIRQINDAHIERVSGQLALIDAEFSGRSWNLRTRDEMIRRMIETGTAPFPQPTIDSDAQTKRREAIKANLEVLGLVRALNDQPVRLTGVGRELAAAKDLEVRRAIVERQIHRFQYPNPLVPTRWKHYHRDFRGLFPHRFLVQLLAMADGRITFDEYDYLVNLARARQELAQAAERVMAWRELAEHQRVQLKQALDEVQLAASPAHVAERRAVRVRANSRRSLGLFGFPRPIIVDADAETISLSSGAVEGDALDRDADPPILRFASKADWLAHYGEPGDGPAPRFELAPCVDRAVLAAKLAKAPPPIEWTAEERRQVEREIERAYAENPDLLQTLEPGLRFEDRQVWTPIGTMDLLCRGRDGKHVVVEVKVGDAEDAAFGQILRYIGWIHRNFEDGERNVRGILLAGGFTDKARYSRIGLLRDDAEDFLQFRIHAFAAEAP